MIKWQRSHIFLFYSSFVIPPKTQYMIFRYQAWIVKDWSQIYRNNNKNHRQMNDIDVFFAKTCAFGFSLHFTTTWPTTIFPIYQGLYLDQCIWVCVLKLSLRKTTERKNTSAIVFTLCLSSEFRCIVPVVVVAKTRGEASKASEE